VNLFGERFGRLLGWLCLLHGLLAGLRFQSSHNFVEILRSSSPSNKTFKWKQQQQHFCIIIKIFGAS